MSHIIFSRKIGQLTMLQHVDEDEDGDDDGDGDATFHA